MSVCIRSVCIRSVCIRSVCIWSVCIKVLSLGAFLVLSNVRFLTFIYYFLHFISALHFAVMSRFYGCTIASDTLLKPCHLIFHIRNPIYLLPLHIFHWCYIQWHVAVLICRYILNPETHSYSDLLIFRLGTKAIPAESFLFHCPSVPHPSLVQTW